MTLVSRHSRKAIMSALCRWRHHAFTQQLDYFYPVHTYKRKFPTIQQQCTADESQDDTWLSHAQNKTQFAEGRKLAIVNWRLFTSSCRLVAPPPYFFPYSNFWNNKYSHSFMSLAATDRLLLAFRLLVPPFLKKSIGFFFWRLYIWKLPGAVCCWRLKNK